MAGTTIDLDALEKRARHSLARLPWWGRLGVSVEDPRDVTSWMKLAAEELPGEMVRSKDFGAAQAAVAAWSAAHSLYEQAARLYHDPQVRAIVGDEATMRHYWNHPDEAMKVAAAHSVEFPRSYTHGPLREVLETIAAVQSFHEDYPSGPGLPKSATPSQSAVSEPVPGPSSPRGRKPEQQKPASSGKKEGSDYDALVAKPHLSKQEWAQLLEWAEEDQAVEEGLLPESYFGEKGGKDADDDA